MTTLTADQAARLADHAVEDWHTYLQSTVLAEVLSLVGRCDPDTSHARWLFGQAFLASCRRDGPLAAACLRQAVRTLAQAETKVAPLRAA
jgi:hypothetical protein